MEAIVKSNNLLFELTYLLLLFVNQRISLLLFKQLFLSFEVHLIYLSAFQTFTSSQIELKELTLII